MSILYNQYCSICQFQHNMQSDQNGHPGEKQCKSCGLVKGLTEFPRNNGSRDGHRHICIACVAQQKAYQQQRNREAEDLRTQENQKLRAYGYRWRKITRHDDWDSVDLTWDEWVLIGPDGNEVTREAALDRLKFAEMPPPLSGLSQSASASHMPLFPLSLPKVQLPPLLGTERQIQWAKQIRDRKLAQARQNLDTLGRHFTTIPDLRLRLVHLLLIAQAGWWISHRDASIEALLQSVKPHYAGYEIRRPYTRTEEEARQLAVQLLRGPTIILDTETTGLGSDARIVEIAMLRENGNLVLNTLINPEVPIPLEATKIHGITDEMVASAPTFAEMWPFICAHLRGSKHIAIYNARYDMAIIRHLAVEVVDHDATMPKCPFREADDVMWQYAAFRGQTHIEPLEAACHALHIPVANSHRALEDVKYVLELLRAMVVQSRAW